MLLIEDKRIYVDKTQIIYDLIKINHAVIISGSRKCGKTLNLSTIDAIFTKNSNGGKKIVLIFLFSKIIVRFFAKTRTLFSDFDLMDALITKILN